MRYIFIEITETHCHYIGGRTNFTIQEPELCVVSCNVVKDEEDSLPLMNPTAELLRLAYTKLVAVYQNALTLKKYDERADFKLRNQLQKAQSLLAELEQTELETVYV